ncbi:MAG: hypothetical protein ACRDH7_10665 [Actinomycetota bacterium]
MTLLHCLVCDDLRALTEGAGEGRCACGNSSAELANGSVIVHGPCRVVWVDDTQVVTTVVGSVEWPEIAPAVVRKPVPPLI